MLSCGSKGGKFVFEAINPKAILIAVNYNFSSVDEFVNKLEEKSIIEKYKLEREEYQFQGQMPPEPILKSVQGFFPCVYKSNDTTINIIYSQNEFKLSIQKDNLTINNFSEYLNLANDVIDLKLSDINAIGVNYQAQYNLGQNKLNLLNNEILTEIPDFSKNKSFEFVLPLEYPERNLIATYRIKKVSGGDNTGIDRIYEVRANFHFNIEKASTAEKMSILPNILSYELYKEFSEKSQGFLKLNNGERG